MLQAGSIVTVHRLGDTAWVIKCREADGLYRVICRTTTPRWPKTRGHFYRSRVVGEGDLALVAPAPVYEVGTTLEHEGVQYTVAADLDEHVELIVPPSRFRLKRGALHVPGGQPHHRRQERPNTGGFEMNEKDFFELELRAQIVPQQARWPAPEHVHWRSQTKRVSG